MIYPNNGLKVFTSWKLEDGSRILAARLDLSAEAAESSRAELPSSELSRAAGFVFEHDRRRFAITRAGLRRLLSHYLAVPATTIELSCQAGGKPTLAGRLADSGLRFNVSHTRNVVVYAFAWDREIGVDVEHLRPLPNATSIAARFFSEDEMAEVESFAPEKQTIAFFRCWTRKEAIAKALGTGLSGALKDFDATLVSGTSPQLMRVRRSIGEQSGWHLHEFQLGEGLIGACVVSAAPVPSCARLSPEAPGSEELALCS